MSKRAWCLIGLVMFAGACNPAMGPVEPYTPSNARLDQLARDTTPVGPRHHGKPEQQIP